jgi:pyruvate dehydrogenase E2 component (dihydrolipoamide acetyltransferase)
MAIAITVPRLGWSMEEGTFVEWLKRDGDQVQVGEPLFVLESEKAAENIDAIDTGILRIPSDAPPAGSTVKVGQVLAFLVAVGEAVPAGVGASNSPPPEPPAKKVGGPTDQPAVGMDRPATIAVVTTSSPRARRVARELGIDWTALRGSGRNGRVRERDVRAAVAATAPGGRFIPHTHARKVIAARMVTAVTVAAPVTLTTWADATNLVDLRRRWQAPAPAPEAVVPGYADLLLKLTAAALRDHPMLQAQWQEDGLFVPDGIHLAFAVDTDAGLLAPVLRDVDRLTVQEITARARELAALARAGQLTGDQLRGGTFTVSNLGALGVDAFTPLLHLPQCATLGVGRIGREPAVVGEQIVARDRITLSLTFDHRVVDGAPAARFLDSLRRLVEEAPPRFLAPTP